MADFDNPNFDAIKISLASPEQIRSWSHGEVKKPETINYRTLKPERDGLFCEKIFGPTKDWECSCGKYKGIRFKGVICEKCGVEVTTAKVRRERMGSIELAAPVSHIWYVKGQSAPLAKLLDIKSKDLEMVLYFASYIITSVDTEARAMDADILAEELAAELESLDVERDEQIERVREQGLVPEGFDDEDVLSEEDIRAEIADIEEEYEEEKELRQEAYDQFMKLEERQLITDEQLFKALRTHYRRYFTGGMGAEAIRELLRNVDLAAESKALREIVADENGQKQRRENAVKRLTVIDTFMKGGNDPANMILDVIPVIPPDLRPMVQLDGGRFAASDLNDLYRRVINRNNRLKRLLDLEAPDIIVNNEKRMLQESVDALFDNGRRGNAVKGRGGRSYKSLSEALKGKQGRFRQNLLGKRVDYSGRSVIVVDPQLKLHQCGLPKEMALELFKPFVQQRLVDLGKADSSKAAKRAIEHSDPMVWDVLEEVISGRLVLLNRAPTLHRLSIQAFEPVLVEGKAIHLHPLVCKPFNADFDGDQMSVHLPLSNAAQTEARVLMLSSNNLRSPASGSVQTVPSQDMVFGVYYLTTQTDGAEGEGRHFADFSDAQLAYDMREGLDLQAKITVRVRPEDANCEEDGRKIFRELVKEEYFVERTVPDLNGEDQVKREKRFRVASKDVDVTDGDVNFETTVGRIIFNTTCLPKDFPFVNFKMNSGDMSKLVNQCCDRYPTAEVEPILDAIKYAGFHYATRAGLTVSLWDAAIPEEKEAMLEETQDAVDQINENYEMGFLSEAERHREVVEAWTNCTNDLGAKMLDGFTEDNPIYMLADSGARGSKTQLRQLAGMRGLMSDMSGDTIDLPIKSNFREGLRPLEYFISTYGARKGLVDTASHTSDSGYLTRRLVDAAQEVVVREEDCHTHDGVTYNLLIPGTDTPNTDLIGRCTLEPVVDPATGEVLLDADAYITSADDIMRLVDAGLEKVELRALLTCRSKYGVCQKCYGWDLSTRRPVDVGTAVGIIAAQSIGEPGTQLTMRTIHSGGVAGAEDITQGLPFVDRMFNVVGNVNERILGREADLANHSGILHITPLQNEYHLEIVAEDDPNVVLEEKDVPASVHFMYGIEDGRPVRAGEQLTSGFVNFRKLRSLTDIESTMHAFVQSVKDVYTSQGVELNDKHIETIARQMLRRVEITDPGDSMYRRGQYVDRYEFADAVEAIVREGGTPPEATPTIMGTLKVAGSIGSWLSNACFIRTTGVLADAAISGDVDSLLDLNSNVIVGKRIPAGTGLKAYQDVELTYHGERISRETSPESRTLPEWAPAELKSIEENMPAKSEWVGNDFYGGYSKNGHTLSSEDAKLYLFDDLGVSQRWTNKFSEVGIETVGDLLGKTEDDLISIEGIGGKALEELRQGLEQRGLLYILEPEDDGADDEDIHALLNMVFSPDADDVLLGTGIMNSNSAFDDELIGGTSEGAAPDAINEDLASLDDLLSRVEQNEDLFGDDD